jgi:RND family efflux transporter MFP subunit
MSIITRILSFARTHKWKLLIAVLILVPVTGLLAVALSPSQPVYVTEVAERGEIKQTVEAVGTVISDRDLQLQFPTSGIVAGVYVKEGDVVKQGQRLAVLRAGNLSADIASASARVQQAEADLRTRQEGTRPEDIAIAEAELNSKRASLETAKTSFKTAEEALVTSQTKLDALKQEALTSLMGYVTNVGSAITQQLTAGQNALSEVRGVYSNNDVIDAVIKYDSAEYTDMNNTMSTAENAITAAYGKSSPADYQQALLSLAQARNAVSTSLLVVNRAFDLMGKLPETSYFDESDRQAHKSTLAAQRTALQTSLNALDAETKSLRDASANFTTRISAEEGSVTSSRGAMERARSDIATFEASVKISEAQLAQKKAPTRKSDIDSAVANVRQARAALARASAEYGNTVLTAPIAGRISKVNVKVGEFTPPDAAVTLLGNSPYRVEMYVSEIDVPKVQVSQSGSIELDAFRGTNFKLVVSQVDNASTDRDGVPKYRVRMDFVYPHDELKIGMTGDAAITTGIQQNVITIPLRAVLEREDGTSYVRIQKEDGTIEDRSVVTGLEGEGSSVEVTGVQEGEVVIVLEKK